MSAKDFDILRQHMLVEISAGIFHVSSVLGRNSAATIGGCVEMVETTVTRTPRR